MHTLTRMFLGGLLTIGLASPAAALVPDTSVDAALDDPTSTQELRTRVDPILVSIHDSADAIPGDPYETGPWESLRDEAAAGIATTLMTRVRECSKGYWAMTYSVFGLYYLAGDTALDGEPTEDALAALSTATLASELLPAAHARAMRSCQRGSPAPRAGGEAASAVEDE